MISVLRWVENPEDRIAGFRVLQLFWDWANDRIENPRPIGRSVNVGPIFSALSHRRAPPTIGPALRSCSKPSAKQSVFGRRRCISCGPGTSRILFACTEILRAGPPILLSSNKSRAPTNREQKFLTDLTLDPPDATSGRAGPPNLDEEYTILSTIHSAKGQEWKIVRILNVVDGCIPSDMATGSRQEIEEERRLLLCGHDQGENVLI